MLEILLILIIINGMPLINCKIIIMLTWSKKYFLVAVTATNLESSFRITDTKLYVPEVTLATKDNAELLEQLNSGLIRTLNWNKYQSKVSAQTQNRYLDFLIDPSFQGVSRIFVLPFEDINVWESYKQYFLPTIEIKDYNLMIDGRNFFDQPVSD